MEQVNTLLAAAGLVVLAIGFFKARLRRTCLTGPMLAVALGVTLSPAALGWVRPERWAVEPLAVLEQVARATVALTLMHAAMHLPQGYVTTHWRRMAVLVGGGTLLMWGAAALCGLATLTPFGSLGVLGAVLVAACCTPNDPVLAGTVATGKIAQANLPARLRHLIVGESAANDALGYPLVILPVLLLSKPAAAAWAGWGLKVLLWEVGGAVLLGVLIGAAAGWLRRLDARHGWSRTDDQTVTTLALTLFVLGATALLVTDAVLAVFAAGLTFRRLSPGTMVDEEDVVQDVVRQLVQLPAFVLIGLLLPWGAWAGWGWAGAGFVALLFALRRPPALAALYVPLRKVGGLTSFREAAFVGWFGPVGIAAVFYATLAGRRLGVEYPWELVSLAVAASVVVHGVTAYPLTRLLNRAGS